VPALSETDLVGPVLVSNDDAAGTRKGGAAR
jgi:hypothetical protein